MGASEQSFSVRIGQKKALAGETARAKAYHQGRLERHLAPGFPLHGRLRLHNPKRPCRVPTMTAEDSDGDDAFLFPPIGFNAGVVRHAVALRLEFAVCCDDYDAREGETQQFVMSREAAIEVGT